MQNGDGILKEIFDGIGDMAKELVDMLPTNDPEKKMQRALEKMKSLKKQEHDVYADIGRKVYQETGAEAYPQEVERLHKIYDERRAAEEEVERLKEEKKREPAQNQPGTQGVACGQCGHVNAEGVKFCRACGQKLDTDQPGACASCGAANPPGTRFCGSCGTRMGGTDT